MARIALPGSGRNGFVCSLNFNKFEMKYMLS